MNICIDFFYIFDSMNYIEFVEIPSGIEPNMRILFQLKCKERPILG